MSVLRDVYHRGVLQCGVVAVFLIALFLLPKIAHAAPSVLTYRYQHYLFQLYPNQYSDWWGLEEVWVYRGKNIAAESEWRSDGDEMLPLPEGVEKKIQPAWNRAAIADVISHQIGNKLYRSQGEVIISKNNSGSVVFDGIGLPGRKLDINIAVTLTIAAMEADVNDIHLPVIVTQPKVTVLDPYLQDRGIQEVITVGESNFGGSPLNRRHNIAVGLSKFNGHLIPKGETFSFNDVLGPVNRNTGYKTELVILGEKTLPEYGGGLCQVSTTAYRGAWEYGFPIAQRRNHSFAVGYYSPQGTDATIYPPNTDMKFVNDSSSDVLIQTHVDGDEAYFIYYGLRDDRKTELIGPYNWGQKPPPPDRIEYTTDISPGTKRKVGSAVPGLRSAWFRIVKKPGQEEEVEGYYSIYEARPLYHQIGVEPGKEGEYINPEEPEWLYESSPENSVSPSKDIKRINPRRLRRDLLQ